MTPGGLSSLLVNQTATNATTNLVGATYNAPAGALQIGHVYKALSLGQFVHTAAATPTITVEVAVAGVALRTFVVTPPSVAATFQLAIEAWFTVRTLGASGTIIVGGRALFLPPSGVQAPFGAADLATGPAIVNTTIARLFELRARMTTAVASNTLTLAQGYWAREVALP